MSKKLKFSNRNPERGVITLMAVLGVGLFALGAALTMATGVLSELATNQDTVAGDQVFYTGESNAGEGAYQYLSTSSYASVAPTLLNDTSTGSVVIVPLAWPYVRARGHAGNGTTRRIVSRIITVFPEGQAFDYAVYSNEEMNFGGNATVNGDVYATDEIDFTGASAEVNGNAFSPGDVETDNVNGFSVTGVDVIEPPRIFIEPYRDMAIAAGTHFTSTPLARSFLNNNITHNIAVVVEDIPELKLQNSTSSTGSLVTLHDLELTGGTYTAAGGRPAIIVYGNLKIAGGTTINGIVYVEGSTTFGSGTNTINGSLISVGGASVDVTGNAVINFDPQYVADWDLLPGLDTSTTSTPEVISWGEE
ncbi:MAG: hypothetical protein Q7S09_03900 [bacterium]|nr:hypothetical protein [bacterium]